MSRYELTRSVEFDLQNIFGWIAYKDSRPAVAESVIERLYDEFERVAENPGVCVYLEGFEGDVRKAVLLRYLILYREVEGGIIVLRVMDGARLIRPEDVETET